MGRDAEKGGERRDILGMAAVRWIFMSKYLIPRNTSEITEFMLDYNILHSLHTVVLACSLILHET